MPLLNYTIEIDAGCTWTRTFTWLTGPQASPVPKDLTGATAVMHFRSDVAPAYPILLTLTDTSGIVLGGPLGTFVPTVTAAQSATLPNPSRLVHSLVITLADGVTKVETVGGSAIVAPVP